MLFLYLNQVQNSQLTLRLVDHKDEVKCRVVAVNDARVLATQHLAPLQKVAYCVGPFGDEAEDFFDQSLLCCDILRVSDESIQLTKKKKS